MAAASPQPLPAPEPAPRIDWESFYRNYKKPGYIQGFEIVNKLGGGAFGLVFKARKESIGKDYAIKFLKIDDESVRDAVARELETVRFFAQIDHPNLVSIEDKGEIDGIPYLVMSYAGQETLRKRLEGGRMNRDDALKIFVQAARGVQALHEHSLVHFDLKPANIFLKGDIARVGDYGLSKLVTESRNSLSFGRGTPYYMAPEMLQRRGDARSDLYSLGVLLYECLCGDVPFKGDSEWEVLRKHETEMPSFPDHLSAADRAILLRCLAKDPMQRYPSVADLLRALQAPVALGESLVFRSEPPRPLPPMAPVASVPPPAAAPAPAPAARPVPPPLPPEALGATPPMLGDADPQSLRDPTASPYGMPWQAAPPSRGVLAFLVRQVFRVLELAIFVVLLPVRAVSAVSGRGAVWLLKLPFRMLGAATRLVGYVVVAALLLLVVMGALALVAG
ncbi:MAG: serine/threonine protein kinase [Planctomycetes bacterium]|nr:serine/threonine protein kinase [Planctomycetota bacterium]